MAYLNTAVVEGKSAWSLRQTHTETGEQSQTRGQTGRRTDSHRHTQTEEQIDTVTLVYTPQLCYRRCIKCGL